MYCVQFVGTCLVCVYTTVRLYRYDFSLIVAVKSKTVQKFCCGSLNILHFIKFALTLFMKFSKFITAQNLRAVFRDTAFMPFSPKMYTGHMATNKCSIFRKISSKSLCYCRCGFRIIVIYCDVKHSRIVLVNNQLDVLFSMYLFISLLYMFRATQDSSSGESNCFNTSSGMISLCRWLPGMPVPDRHTRQSPTQSDTYQMMYWNSSILLMMSPGLLETCREGK